MERAKITLTGPLSLAVGRYRFQRGIPVSCTDKDLIKYAMVNPRFKVEELPPEEKTRKGRKPSTRAGLSRRVKDGAAT